MAKKDIDEIPDIDDKEIEDSEESIETTEPEKEESKLQLVTSEQLTQYKLDNLSLDVQDSNSKLQELVLHIKSLVEILRKRK